MGFDFLDFGFPKSGTDWKSINGKPYITVSSKGRSNGLSTKINDGADFGPDTKLNATAPSQTGAPYTNTSALKEAMNYAIANKIPEIRLITNGGNNTFSYNSGTNDNYDLTPLNNFNFEIKGEGDSIGAYIYFPPNSGMTLNNLGGMSVVFSGLGLEGASNSYGLTINGNPSSVSGAIVFFRDIVMGGINGKAQVFINNVIFVANEIALSDYSAPSIQINDCFVYISAIVNIGYIQINGTASNTGFSAIINYYKYSFPVSSTTQAAFQNIGYVKIGTLDSATAMLFGGTNGVVVIDDLIVNGSNGTNPPFDGYIAGIGTSPTIDKLIINNVPVTYNAAIGSQQPAVGSSITVNELKIKYRSLILSPPITTPSIPASGTAQANTYQAIIDVYIYGGTVTEIQITRNGTAYTVFSNATGSALSGQVYKLNPLDSITLTYTTAPTWDVIYY